MDFQQLCRTVTKGMAQVFVVDLLVFREKGGEPS